MDRRHVINIWVVSLLAVFILPYLGLKKYLQEQRA